MILMRCNTFELLLEMPFSSSAVVMPSQSSWHQAKGFILSRQAPAGVKLR